MSKEYENWKSWVELGADVEFSYRGKAYTLTHVPGGVKVGEQNNDADDNNFSDVDDLMNHYVINGVQFEDALEDIEIIYSSF